MSGLTLEQVKEELIAKTSLLTDATTGDTTISVENSFHFYVVGPERKLEGSRPPYLMPSSVRYCVLQYCSVVTASQHF